MTRTFSPSVLLPAVQSSVSAGVFGLFFLAQLFAYLLYLYPRSGWFWFLSLVFNREAAPFLELFDAALPLNPIASCAVLACPCILPLVFFYRRSWLGTAAAGHLALFVAMVPVTIAITDGEVGLGSASLSGMADFASGLISATLWMLAASALLPLCIFNHVTFFHDMRHRVSTGAERGQTGSSLTVSSNMF